MISRLDHLLADAALGALDPARSLFVASLASLKPEIAREIARYEAAGGALLAAIRPSTRRPGAIERPSAPTGRASPAAPPELVDLPEPLRATVAEALRRGAWRRLLPGIQALDLSKALPRAKDGTAVIAQLIRVHPGCAIPRHSHGGEEIALVLAGGYTDETGHYGAGDYAIVDPAVTHRPVADPGVPCLCLVIADTTPRFTSLLGALIRAWEWIWR
jgi:putative transcriptional regulator